MNNPCAGLLADLKVLFCMACRPIRGRTHAERLASYFSGQTDAYDSFRKRLLTGREDLMKLMTPAPGETWADFGCGTGANLEYLDRDSLASLKKIWLVDLTESLLETARIRIGANGWTNAETVRADATEWSPPDGKLDAALFSYSLTMIPDWFAAVDRAYEALKPGGTIGVVDFFIARKFPDPGLRRQSFSTRWFWPIWFSFDNLHLSDDILPYLTRKFETVAFEERADRMPYCPVFWKKMPRFIFVGRKPDRQTPLDFHARSN